MKNVSKQDQALLWQNYLTDITKSMAGVKPNNVIAISNKIDCVFDATLTASALAQAYNIGNSIPGWNIHWDGQFESELFTIYKAWVQDLSGSASTPKPGTKKEQTQLSTLEQKLRNYGAGLTSVNLYIYNKYINANCINPISPKSTDDSGKYTCASSDWIGSDASQMKGFVTYRTEHLKDSDIQQKLTLLRQDLGADLASIQQQIVQLRNTIYGSTSTIQTLTEAQKAVMYGDTLDGSAKADGVQKQYQMQIQENDTSAWEPRFIAGAGGSFNTYYQWVQKQKARKGQPLMGANSGANVVSVITDSKKTDQGSKWQFTANLGVPIDWFWLGGSASGSHSKDTRTDYEFKATTTFQDVTYVPLKPGDWFQPGLFSLFSDFKAWPSNSRFQNKDIFGPKGIMNTIISGVIVGYAPYMRLEFTDSTTVNDVTTWSTGASFGIGPFKFESGSASGSSWNNETTMTGNVIEMKDTSQIPKIIAVVVDTPNYTFPG